jgi:N-terminal acetyltransferase B complex catalytic subunit
MGKSEGKGSQWHGHVTVLTVAPAYRRLGIAAKLMDGLESVSTAGDMFFVDLFVRVSNVAAIKMYERRGYTVYRRVLDYYSEPAEDAYGESITSFKRLTLPLDMRKALPRDRKGLSVIPLKHPVHASDL